MGHAQVAITGDGDTALSAETNEDGEFALRVPGPGVYRLLDAQHPDLVDRLLVPTVFSTEGGQPVVLTARAAAAISVRVVDACTRSPIAGARVAELDTLAAISRESLLPEVANPRRCLTDATHPGTVVVPVAGCGAWVDAVVMADGYESRGVALSYEVAPSCEVDLLPAGQLRIAPVSGGASDGTELWLWRSDAKRDPITLPYGGAPLVLRGLPVGAYGVAVCRRTDAGTCALVGSKGVQVTHDAEAVVPDLASRVGAKAVDVVVHVAPGWALRELELRVCRSLPQGWVVTESQVVAVEDGLAHISSLSAQEGDYVVIPSIGFIARLLWGPSGSAESRIPDPVNLGVRVPPGTAPEAVGDPQWRLVVRGTGDQGQETPPHPWSAGAARTADEWRVRVPRTLIELRAATRGGESEFRATIDLGSSAHGDAPRVRLVPDPARRVTVRFRKGTQFLPPDPFQLLFRDRDGALVTLMAGGGPVVSIERFLSGGGDVRIVGPAGAASASVRIPSAAFQGVIDVDVAPR